MHYLNIISLFFLIFFYLNSNSQIKELDYSHVKNKSRKKDYKSTQKYNERQRKVIPRGVFRHSEKEKDKKNKIKKKKDKSNIAPQTERKIRKEKFFDVKGKEEEERNKTVVYSEKKRGIKHKRNIWGQYKRNKEKRYKKPQNFELFPPEIKNKWGLFTRSKRKIKKAG